MENALNALKPFLDADGRLLSTPAKYKKQLIALWYLSEKIDTDRQYTLSAEIKPLEQETYAGQKNYRSIFHERLL